MLSPSRAFGALAVVLVGTPLLLQQGGGAKIAYVNTQTIMEAAPGRRAVDSILQRELGLMQLQVQKWSDSVQTMINKFQQVQATLSAAERDKRANSIDQLRAEFTQKTEDLQQRAQARQGELVQPLLDQVKLVLEDVRVEGGWTMIMDITGNSPIVAADKNLNISDRVIAKLRTLPPPPIVASKPEDAGKAQKAAPGPIQAPAGIRAPGSPGAATPPTTKKADSTAAKGDSAKKGDSTKVKRPDSTVTKRPDTAESRAPRPGSMQP